MPVTNSVQVTGLHIYPVKSCRGIALTEVRLTSRGFEWDREWMIVDETGRAVTQRQLLRLALVGTEITERTLRLSAPGQAVLEVPLSWSVQPSVNVQVGKHECPALDEGAAAARWLTDALGQPLRLVRFKPEHRRLSSQEWTGGVEAENRFTDGFPVLVLSEESLAGLNRRLGPEAAVPLDRFRANLVITGAGPHSEDRMPRLLGDGIELRLIKPCTRCRITTTDQRTAEVRQEPLRTLASYRRDERLAGVTFGMNAILTEGVGKRLKVGMRLSTE